MKARITPPVAATPRRNRLALVPSMSPDAANGKAIERATRANHAARPATLEIGQSPSNREKRIENEF